jgi:sterol desaturase/sphingolipid hydroxylase (fatty acid hydroxylase superfamily)
MDPTVAAVPAYFATMAAERQYLKARAQREGPSPADYERHDTIASLAMGVGSLLAPLVLPKLLAPITPGKGRHAKKLIGVAVAAAAVTTVADRVARRNARRRGADAPDPARTIASRSSVVAITAGGVAITTAWTHLTNRQRMWERRFVRDLGTGPVVLAATVLAWDFIYYFNHRFMHESRYMWAIHEVHHSSERYNLSTALRQPVADAFGTFVPYSVLSLFGIRPELISTARGINLLYQYWIHTDTIRRLGPFERMLNTPSHHRVHHGANRQYIDRNHGSIFIVWDRLFGTFEPEGDAVVYGLTKNIKTFNPVRVGTHEHAEMLDDVARSTTWRERLSYVLRGPGWAYAQQKERAAAQAEIPQARLVDTHRAVAGGPEGRSRIDTT